MKIAILPGDGIGPEIVARGASRCSTRCAATACRSRPKTRRSAARATTRPAIRCRRRRSRSRRRADAVLFGAVGGPHYDTLPRAMRPEQGILGMRKALGAVRQPAPGAALSRARRRSTLKPEVVAGPRHHDRARADRRHLFRRAARPPHERGRRARRLRHDALRASARSSASRASASRRRASASSRLCSVDKANVLDTSHPLARGRDRGRRRTIRTSR